MVGLTNIVTQWQFFLFFYSTDFMEEIAKTSRKYSTVLSF